MAYSWGPTMLQVELLRMLAADHVGAIMPGRRLGFPVISWRICPSAWSLIPADYSMLHVGPVGCCRMLAGATLPAAPVGAAESHLSRHSCRACGNMSPHEGRTGRPQLVRQVPRQLLHGISLVMAPLAVGRHRRSFFRLAGAAQGQVLVGEGQVAQVDGQIPFSQPWVVLSGGCSSPGRVTTALRVSLMPALMVSTMADRVTAIITFSRVEWFNTFWRFSKTYTLLSIRYIFRNSVPKNRQVQRIIAKKTILY